MTFYIAANFEKILISLRQVTEPSQKENHSLGECCPGMLQCLKTSQETDRTELSGFVQQLWQCDK